MPAPGPVVGFDLDMTLIDSRPGIRAVYERLVAESGAAIDVDLVVSRLGPPVEWELAHWLPEVEVTRWADRYRELYPEIALPLVEALPGAHAAIEAANLRGRTILITAKNGPNARLHVDRLGLPVGEVFGQAWRDGKAAVLREQGATTYVGDHVHDMEAAQLAGVLGIGVATGPSSADELREAGAADVLTSLEPFPEWLDNH
jgi:phosphoglycolate phosphatase